MKIKLKIGIILSLVLMLLISITACGSGQGFIDVTDSRADVGTLGTMTEVIGYTSKVVLDTQIMEVSGQPPKEMVWPVLSWAINYSLAQNYQNENGVIVLSKEELENLYKSFFAQGKLPSLNNEDSFECGKIEFKNEQYYFYPKELGQNEIFFDMEKYKILDNGDYLIYGTLTSTIPDGGKKTTYKGEIVMHPTDEKILYPFSMYSLSLTKE